MKREKGRGFRESEGMNGDFGEITKLQGHLGNVKTGVEGYC